MYKKLKLRYRYSVILLKELVRTDFKLRYQGSVLGYLWSLLRPLFLFVILYLVFTKFLKVGDSVPHYPVYLLLGIILWNFFVETTSGSVASIVNKGELLRKINFPKYVIILSVALSALINLFLNFIVIAIFMYFNGVSFRLQDFLLIPLIFELFVFAVSCSFFLSAAFVKFRDVSYIWDVLVQLGFYLTPILYPFSKLPIRFGKFIILSPISQTIQESRRILVTNQATTIGDLFKNNYLYCSIPFIIVIIVAIISMIYFRRSSKNFAEEV
jgi:ABC-2 type transport system permease protein